MDVPLPPHTLCERCWREIHPDDKFVRFAHVGGSTLTGDIAWANTYLHHWDPVARTCTTS